MEQSEEPKAEERLPVVPKMESSEAQPQAKSKKKFSIKKCLETGWCLFLLISWIALAGYGCRFVDDWSTRIALIAGSVIFAGLVAFLYSCYRNNPPAPKTARGPENSGMSAGTIKFIVSLSISAIIALIALLDNGSPEVAGFYFLIGLLFCIFG